MNDIDSSLPERRATFDPTNPLDIELLRSAFLGVDPDDAGPGIRRGRRGKPIVTVSKGVFKDIEAGRSVGGLGIKNFPEE